MIRTIVRRACWLVFLVRTGRRVLQGVFWLFPRRLCFRDCRVCYGTFFGACIFYNFAVCLLACFLVFVSACFSACVLECFRLIVRGGGFLRGLRRLTA